MWFGAKEKLFEMDIGRMNRQQLAAELRNLFIDFPINATVPQLRVLLRNVIQNTNIPNGELGAIRDLITDS